MSYRICDVDVAAALSDVRLAPDQNGIAVVVRRKGRPVAFWMERRSAGTELTARDLARMISERAAMKLLEEAIREEIAGPAPATQGFPSLTIAVCTRDRSERLERCLDSLPVEGAEILVVDDCPSDGRTRDVVAARRGVRYVREPKPGLDFARNRALREARGELCAFVDDDVVLDREWLGGLREAWAENPDAAAFTGLVLPLALETEAQILFEELGGFRGGVGRGFDKVRWGRASASSAEYPCDAGVFGTGANMIVRRAVVLALGGFDEALDTGAPLPGGGDLDLFYRLVRGGHVIAYEPRCLALHEHRAGADALRRQFWSWGIGFTAFAVKSLRADHERRVVWRRALAVWFLRYHARRIGRAVIDRNSARLRIALAEVAGGLEGLLGGYRRSQRRSEQIRHQFV